MIFVMTYWSTLADLGTFEDSVSNNTSNNPFVNTTLLINYAKFFNSAYPGTQNPAPTFGPANGPGANYDANKFELPPTVFLETYSCSMSVQKAPLSILLVLVTGLYAFFMGGYKALTFTITWYYKRRDGDTRTNPFLRAV